VCVCVSVLFELDAGVQCVAYPLRAARRYCLVRRRSPRLEMAMTLTWTRASPARVYMCDIVSLSLYVCMCMYACVRVCQDDRSGSV
jgi:hypothetical protein